MKWVKVEDQMPEKDQNVLVFFGGDVIMIAWWDGNDWAENSEEIEAHGGFDGAYLTRVIEEREYYKLTHWMPLPNHPN